VYVDPQPSDEALAEVYTDDYFTEPAVEGEPAYIDNRAGLERFFEGRLRRIERFVRPGRLLEVGSGLGYLLNVARRRGWRVVGLELSQFGAKYARESFQLDVRQQTLEEAAFDGGSFDAVVMRDLIEHVRQPRAVLLEARRVLREGGLLGLSTQNFASVNSRLGGPAWRHLQPEQHLYQFTPDTIRRLLPECGFEILEMHSRYFSPSTREVYAALSQRRQRRQLAWHAALRGDIVFLPLGSSIRRLLRAAAIVLSGLAFPFRDSLSDDILEICALKKHNRV